MRVDYSKFNALGVLLYIWQLPQVLISLIIWAVLRNRKFYTLPHRDFTVVRVEHNRSFCFSLGPFLFTSRFCSSDIVKHEAGHSLQSLFLGPLYLLVVGVPSFLLFWFCRLRKKGSDFYHSKYPESWADRLGGVVRKGK